MTTDTPMVDGLGPRARIGILVPDANTTVQPECEAMRPDGVTNHVSRIPNIKPPSADMLGFSTAQPQVLADALVALARVLPCEPSLVILGHSVDAFCGGVAGARQYEAALNAAANGVPVEVPSLAMHAAFAALGAAQGRPIRRIGILTPFGEAGDAVTAMFFRDAGYEVAQVIGLKCGSATAIAKTPPDRIRAGLKTLCGLDVDGVVQVGTNLPVQRMAVEAEAWFEKPVVQVNAAMYWHALRTLGIADRLPGRGRLFQI